MPRPLIGLTTTLLPDGNTSVSGIRRTYIQAILDAGGAPILIPPAPEAVLRDTFEHLDGLLLPGGVDIDPARYGEEPHPKLGQVQPERDHLELTLCRWALSEGMPLFAICRGIQVLNVAAGGTLYQDIASQYETNIEHASPPGLPRGYLAHDVRPQKGTRFARLVGGEPLPVNSWHHQAVKVLGQGLIVSGCAPDSIVEAVEATAHPFALGVQFHPEDLYADHARIRCLFTAFVAACAG